MNGEQHDKIHDYIYLVDQALNLTAIKGLRGYILDYRHLGQRPFCPDSSLAEQASLLCRCTVSSGLPRQSSAGSPRRWCQPQWQDVNTYRTSLVMLRSTWGQAQRPKMQS